MANPQKEDGFTPIANEIIENIAAFKLNGTQYAIILIILRYTYGFHRLEHAFSANFLAKATNANKSQIIKELKSLNEQGLIIRKQDATFSTPATYMFNKDFDRWSKKNQLPNLSTPQLPNLSTKKDNININLHKNIFCTFFDDLWEMYPSKKAKQRVTVKSLKAINTSGYENMCKCIQRCIDEKPDWQHYQNGSTFFNSGYLDYLDDNTDNTPHNTEQLTERNRPAYI